MIKPRDIVCMVFAFALSLSVSGPLLAAPAVTWAMKKILNCGDAQLIAETLRLKDVKSTEPQCTKQTIRLINSKKGISKKLPLEGKLVRENFGLVLDAFVTDWDCLKSREGTQYILLWYGCNGGFGCQGPEREWERIFTTGGTNLTAGFQKQRDPRLDKLYQQLGLSRDDIHFKSVIFDK